MLFYDGNGEYDLMSSVLSIAIATAFVVAGMTLPTGGLAAALLAIGIGMFAVIGTVIAFTFCSWALIPIAIFGFLFLL